VLNDVASWITQRSRAWRENIQTMSIDPHVGYLTGILAVLCDVTVTADHFHAIRLANTMVDDVYRATQKESLGQRGCKLDPLCATRGLMTRGWERLSNHQHDRLFGALLTGDPEGEVAASILAKELLREAYAGESLQLARSPRLIA